MGRTWFHPCRQLYRQECFLGWNQWETEHGRKWKQNFCIKIVMTPSAQGRLIGLYGDFEFAFNALDIIAPDKLWKKEFLEYLRRFLEKSAFSSSPNPYHDRDQARSWATSISLCWPREAYSKPIYSIYLKRKVSLCFRKPAHQILLGQENKCVQRPKKPTALWKVHPRLPPEDAP